MFTHIAVKVVELSTIATPLLQSCPVFKLFYRGVFVVSFKKPITLPMGWENIGWQVKFLLTTSIGLKGQHM